MDTEIYMKEANSQLSDKNIYKTLQTETTLQHKIILGDLSLTQSTVTCLKFHAFLTMTFNF